MGQICLTRREPMHGGSGKGGSAFFHGAMLGWWCRFGVTRFSSSMTARLPPSGRQTVPPKRYHHPAQIPLPNQLKSGTQVVRLMGSDLADPVRHGRRTGAPMDGFTASQTNSDPISPFTHPNFNKPDHDPNIYEYRSSIPTNISQ
ncbi:hypothetical protein [Nitrincola sp. A-D6]|uniref:hypothetical protein n=1 Tax=Nitrincola sp. A-D6 TaxID=1545442 RepID=UPI0011860966|nr:hypothetical protein [Nitrincola sp. A-D6]